jgi:hypothetical protein
MESSYMEEKDKTNRSQQQLLLWWKAGYYLGLVETCVFFQ